MNIFSELFLSQNLWGYFGPFLMVAIGIVLAKKKEYRTLAFLWFLVEVLAMAFYFSFIADGTLFYWWHIIILLIGGIFGCLLPAASRK